MALLVVALATTAAAGLIFRQHAWTRQMELVNDASRARLAAVAGLTFAGAILRDDDYRSTADHLGEPWAMPLPATEVEGAEIAGQMYDQQGLFNLNNLIKRDRVDVPNLKRFQKLLRSLDLPDTLAEPVADWLDANDERHDGRGQEDSLASELKPPRRPANRAMVDVNELLLVPGLDRKTLEILRPYVTALPTGSRVNVNTAPAEILNLMVEGLTLAEARVMVSDRDRIWYKDPADFRARLPRPDLSISEADIDTRSQYFLAVADSRFGRARTEVRALLFRQPRQWPTTVWQRFD